MQIENKWQDSKEELTNEYNIFIERVIVENPFEDTEELTDEHRTIIKASLNFWLSKIDTAIAEERKDAQEEYKQFILNLLDGIDIADGECGTKAIRHAIKSRLIE